MSSEFVSSPGTRSTVNTPVSSWTGARRMAAQTARVIHVRGTACSVHRDSDEAAPPRPFRREESQKERLWARETSPRL